MDSHDLGNTIPGIPNGGMSSGYPQWTDIPFSVPGSEFSKIVYYHGSTPHKNIPRSPRTAGEAWAVYSPCRAYNILCSTIFDVLRGGGTILSRDVLQDVSHLHHIEPW